MESLGPLSIDLNSCRVYYAGKPVPLHRQSYKLLLLFFRNPHLVLTPEKIIDYLWTEEKVPTNSTLRSHIKLLRRSFKKAGATGEIVKNVRGIGYQLAVPHANAGYLAAIPLPIAEKLMRIHETEYVEVDSNDRIAFHTPGIAKYCDFPGPLIGAKVMEAFPVLVGLEGIFEDIRNNRRETFSLKDIALSLQAGEVNFINIYITNRNHLPPSSPNNPEWKGCLLVFIEDDTENMREREQLIGQFREVGKNALSELGP